MVKFSEIMTFIECNLTLISYTVVQLSKFLSKQGSTDGPGKPNISVLENQTFPHETKYFNLFLINEKAGLRKLSSI